METAKATTGEAGMKINPRNFKNYDAFADAVAHAAIQSLPAATNYDSYDERKANRQVVRDALDAAEDKAMAIWEAYVEHMEDLYESGVGPSWEGMI